MTFFVKKSPVQDSSEEKQKIIRFIISIIRFISLHAATTPCKTIRNVPQIDFSQIWETSF